MTILRGCFRALLFAAVSGSAVQAQEGLPEWLQRIDAGLSVVEQHARAGDVSAARSQGVRVYLDQYEMVEGWYGPGGAYEASSLSAAITQVESGFHVLIRSNSAAELAQVSATLRKQVAALQRVAQDAGVNLYPQATPVTAAQAAPERPALVTAEMRRIDELLSAAEANMSLGRNADALREVEEAYLEGFEPLESRLPSDLVGGIERSFHLQLRPALKSSAAPAELAAHFSSLRAQLVAADRALAAGTSFWFGAFNSFTIIMREGLEAVLLLAALLAYLHAARAGRVERARVWAGAGAGVVASLATWVVAVTLVPVGGASRELVEGITALIAVAVLLYVSHWLFQKTYIHDWKAYLRDRLGTALTRGSALAMMGLAFAAVYREGFETVLFYQALLLDAGSTAVLAGFAPGILFISCVGWAIIRAGVKLPLKQVFAVTNSILLYLAFVFLGKGIYNLQESGAFAAHPVEWLPAHPLLQQVFGFYPLVETLLAQLTLAGLLLVAMIVYRRQLVRVRTVPVARPSGLAA